jgi:dTDP-4-dehydrorhamnose reductase
MNILLTGGRGQLGRALSDVLAPEHALRASDVRDLDLTDGEAVRRWLSEQRPQVILNAAAYTDVDGAETQRDQAFAVNATAPKLLAEQARALGSLLIHFSTDYVFDGEKGSPYVEDDPPRPVNVYGQTKLAGERAVEQAGGAYLILRTSWLYSPGGGANFVDRVLAWARSQDTLRVVDDQVANPTSAAALAAAVAGLLRQFGDNAPGWRSVRSGVYHAACRGHCSRYEWAQAILELDPRPEEQRTRRLLAARSGDFPTPADRPACSALDCERLGVVYGVHLPGWREALATALAGAA